MRHPHRVQWGMYLLAALAGAWVIPADTARGAPGEQMARLTAWDAQAGDGFGSSVAVAGQIVIVGAPTPSTTPGPGAAYVYDLNSGDTLFTLTASDSTVGDLFGSSVAVDNATAIIGAAFGGSDTSALAGAAYLYDVNTGAQLFKLTASNTEALDRFGSSVSISGTTAVVGAWADNTSAGVDAGSAYLFDTTTGNQLSVLTASDANADARFGSSVAVAAGTALIGAYRDTERGTGSGAAYVFDTATGTQAFKLTATDASAGAHFGWSVAVGGGLAVVGAPTSNALPGRGAAYVFDMSTGDQLFKLTASDATVGDRFGTSVAVGQGVAIIGATLGAADPSSLAGAAYVFDLTSGQQLAKLTASDTQAIDYFGGSVTIDGTTAAIGAHGSNTADGVDAGSAYLFSLTIPIPADLDGDGFVGLSDLNVINSHWNLSVTPGDPLQGDPTGDGFVGVEDLTFVLNAWNSGTPPPADGAAFVPEPTCASIFITITSIILRRRIPRPHSPS
jgi:FG-GAP repeat